MDKDGILTILKTDLQICTAAYDSYLVNLIDLAIAAIVREGIDLSGNSVKNRVPGTAVVIEPENGILEFFSAEDGALIEMYAAFLFRKRRETELAMPRMLRWQLNNRLFSQKAGE